MDSDDFIKVLTGAGWEPGRRVDIGPAKAAWHQHGYAEIKAAEAFAESFDQLAFRYPRHPLNPGFHTCNLDIVREVNCISRSRVKEYEERVGEALTPVGFAASGALTLLIAFSGRMYGGYDAFLAQYGENGYGGLRNIFYRVSPVEVLPSPFNLG